MLPKTRTWAACLGYLFLGLFGLLLVLASAGAIYLKIEYSQDRRMRPPPGRLVDVGGYRMHIDCIGKGSPTVVLDSGLSDSSLSWYKVQPEVAKFTRVCSYDRAGLGWSEPSRNPRNSGVFAEELHTVLHNAKINSPFVLVGHSMGGYDVRIFASRFPSEVVGMVLVDSAHPDLAKPAARTEIRPRGVATATETSRISNGLRPPAPDGMVRQRPPRTPSQTAYRRM